MPSGYRDGRTTGMDQLVYDVISLEKLYGRTGIQKQIFNTIYQLMAVKQENPEHMEKAVSMLMIPDYLNFVLTGNKAGRIYQRHHHSARESGNKGLGF